MNRQPCPECAQHGQPVERLTLKALLCHQALARLEAGSYWFCTTPTCQVVYFSEGDCSIYHKPDLKVRVGCKEIDDPIPLCYCFGHTVTSVREEIARTQQSTVMTNITTHIQAGRCGCEVNNPSGKCCLGDVNKFARESLP